MGLYCGSGSSVGIATDYGLDGPGTNPGGDEMFRTRPDRSLGPHSLLYNGYRVFPEGKVRSGRAADHSYLYPSSGPHRPVTESLYIFYFFTRNILCVSANLVKPAAFRASLDYLKICQLHEFVIGFPKLSSGKL